MAFYQKALCAFLLILFGCPVQAGGWQYTHWGMTPEQVVAASSGHARPIPTDEVKGKSFTGTACLYEQDFTAGSLELHATLCFDKGTGTLSKVSVKPTTGDCPRVGQAMIQKYGAAFRTEKTVIATNNYWKDADGETTILYMEFGQAVGGGCQINYDQVHSKEALGL